MTLFLSVGVCFQYCKSIRLLTNKMGRNLCPRAQIFLQILRRAPLGRRWENWKAVTGTCSQVALQKSIASHLPGRPGCSTCRFFVFEPYWFLYFDNVNSSNGSWTWALFICTPLPVLALWSVCTVCRVVIVTLCHVCCWLSGLFFIDMFIFMKFDFYGLIYWHFSL